MLQDPEATVSPRKVLQVTGIPVLIGPTCTANHDAHNVRADQRPASLERYCAFVLRICTGAAYISVVDMKLAGITAALLGVDWLAL
jgi:hypothetical protein